jgi:uncharacterized membrane protein required for colicin V production
MVLGTLTILIMLIVAFAYWREGLLTAFCMCVNVMLAGLVAFDFWEPLADLIDPMIAGTILSGYEDATCLFLLFVPTLLFLRWATNQLAARIPDFHPVLQQIGGAVLGLATGYLLAGFLVCWMQTLPWHERFMDFNPDYDPNEASAPVRRVFPPDRVWLALMHRLSSDRLDFGGDPFDRNGSFELRYARYRRYGDSRDALPYKGESPP